MRKFLLVSGFIAIFSVNAAIAETATLINNIVPPPVNLSPVPQISLNNGLNVYIYPNINTFVPSNFKIQSMKLLARNIPLPADCQILLKTNQEISFIGQMVMNSNGQISIPNLNCTSK